MVDFKKIREAIPQEGPVASGIIVISMLGMLLFFSLGVRYLSEYGIYSHKRTGRLIHCNVEPFSYFVNEIYSFHAHGDTSFDNTHNCTIVGSKRYSQVAHARHAAANSPLGAINTIFVSYSYGNSCIAAETRHADYVMGLSFLLLSPVFPFVLCFLGLCASDQSVYPGTYYDDIESPGGVVAVPTGCPSHPKHNSAIVSGSNGSMHHVAGSAHAAVHNGYGEIATVGSHIGNAMGNAASVDFAMIGNFLVGFVHLLGAVLVNV